MKYAMLLALVGAAAWAEPPRPACSLVPGWTQKGEPRSYQADNLFEYMDGNAEGYVIYGFQAMNGVTCTKGGVTFVVDISDMGDTDSAYGIFTANRDPRNPATSIGMGGQIVPRRAIFAKGKFYAEIAANPEGDHSAALVEWTRALDGIISGSTKTPVALGWFPEAGRQSIRLVPESVLGIRVLTKGYAAQYEYGKSFLVIEATQESAAAVMKKLRARFAGAADAKAGDEAFQAEDQYLGRLCFFRKGRYLGGWANVADGHDPVAASAALSASIP